MEETLFFNGIDAATGHYLLPPTPPRRLGSLLTSGSGDPRSARFAPVLGADPWDLAASGWCMIAPPDLDGRVRDALEPLLALRRRQAGERYREISAGSASTLRAFLLHAGAGTGPLKPEVLPYYVLLVGGPRQLPFRLQRELAVSRAVGRVAFSTPEEYARYAQSVVAAEVGDRRPARPRTVLFAPRHDPATAGTADRLVTPLARDLAASCPGWRIATRLGAEASKESLLSLLGGEETPAVLLTATHGVAFSADDPRHGSLLCAGWSGAGKMPDASCYVAARDVASAARLGGLVSLHLGLCTGGTPRHPGPAGALPGALSWAAPAPRVSRLACRLLAHPEGGSLAFVGVVGQAWDGTGPCAAEQRLEVFFAAVGEMLHGLPVGAAMAYFSTRHLEMAWRLAGPSGVLRGGSTPPVAEVVPLWLAAEASRGYVVLGDPAVRVGGFAR